ncbi:TIGR00266 family protein [Leptospira interrogans serovar Pyrogenes str. 200701872]|nr:TIGR00266 family protein [Leptospira interrogans serovar Pyrogenes str. 200701872]
MVYMTPGIDVETKMGSGFLSAISRRFFGGESFFFNVFKASVTGGEIGLAPELPGDIVGIDLTDTGLIVESGAYLASDETISIKPMFGGIRSFFGGEGIFLLEAFGNGKLFLNAYGGIIPIDVQGSYTIDTGHIVAFDKSLQYKIAKAGGSWKSTFFGGEGLVMEFTGHGRVLIQTRVPSGFLSWLTALLPN